MSLKLYISNLVMTYELRHLTMLNKHKKYGVDNYCTIELKVKHYFYQYVLEPK